MKRISILLLMLICFIFLISYNVNAESINKQDISNVILFVKFKGDNKDVFNAKYSNGNLAYENWNNIKKMYNENIAQGSDNSFKKYISAISEGKLNVENYFPQENIDNNFVNTYTLDNDLSYYQSSDMIIQEVIGAINNSKIEFNLNEKKLANLNPGLIDNFTVIIQGSSSTPSSIIYPHKSQYSGSEKIKGLRVSNYNIIPSGAIITDDASLGAKQSQGVIAHEFLHILGFPDLYRSSGKGEPVGLWDVMAKNSSFLQYPLSYLRAKHGWVDMPYISNDGIYTLTAVSEGGGNKVFAIKTPLSDSEYIILEYRKKNANNYNAFEHRIPSSGLLMYRVNDKVEYQTNINGENYIYVYRPNVTNRELGTDIATSGNYKGYNQIYDAALEPDKGETEYGSTDLSLDYKNNTLYYSDGSNSGVKISNLKLSDDNNKITFKLEFADYINEGIWDTIGTVDSNFYGNPVLYTDKNTNSLYIAYSIAESSIKKTVVKKWDGSKWDQIGNEIVNTNSPDLVQYNGSLYLICENIKDGHLTYYKLSEQTWTKLGEYQVEYPQNVKWIEAKDTLYVMYEETVSGLTTKLVVKDIINNKTIFEKQAQNFGNPSISYYNDKLYLAYSDYFGINNNATIELYDIEKNSWKAEQITSINGSNVHIIKEYNNKLYLLIGKNGVNPSVYVYDGVTWSENKISQMQNYINPTINIINGNVYISYIDTIDNKSYIVRLSNNKSEIYDDKLGTSYNYLYTINDKNNMYAITVSKNSNDIIVRKKEIEKEVSTKKEGWVYENNNTYYYIDEKKQKCITEIGGKKYFLGCLTGILKRNEFVNDLEGKTYYADSNGEVVTGFYEINGNTYYFDEKGAMQKGIIELGGEKYFLGCLTGILKKNTTVYDTEGKLYYTDEEGIIYTGFHNVNNYTYYFDKNGQIMKGIITINGKEYFLGYLTGILKRNEFVKDLEGKIYYADSNGEVVTYFYEINGNTYYFDEKGIMQKGITKIGEKNYFLGCLTGILKRNEFVNDLEGKAYYADSNGEVVTGFYEINGNTYYFNEKGIIQKGITKIGEKNYFLGCLTGILKRNEFVNDLEGKAYYADSNGEVVTGFYEINGNTYYFDEKGAKQKGITEIAGSKYFLGCITGILKRNEFVNDLEGKTYYTNSDGVIHKGIITIDGKEYFLGYRTGILKRNEFVKDLEGKTYYADSEGIIKKGTHSIYGNEYTFDENGVLTFTQYIPRYYNQKDISWSNIRYGLSTMGGTGCAPTSMAMAFSSILTRTILPTDVANYLYNYTNEFNKNMKGSSGLAIIYASNYYGIKATALNSIEDIKKALKSGKIVYAAMGNGKFATPFYNHAIVVSQYKNAKTLAYDPLKIENNTWVSVEQLWNEQSKDPDDYRGGSNFYRLESY